MRLRQELRLKIQQVLEENGIYTDAVPGCISIVDLLADAVLGIPAFSRANAAERYKVAPIGKDAQRLALARLALGERVEAQLGIMVDHNNKAWTRVLNNIVNAEENGESFDKFVKWFKAGTVYDRPKTFQIAKNPALLWGNWKEAQAFETVTEPTRNEDGSINAF